MIDTHCHINSEPFQNDPASYVKEAKNAGVFSFLICGTTVEDSKLAIKIAEENPGCFAAVGIHPEFAKDVSDADLEEIRKLAKHPKVLAIGEIGLDFYWEKDPAICEKQKKVFIKQIEIANELNLPISIHCREATEICLNVVKNYKVNKAGIMHCYAGSFEIAKEYIKLGFLLGFGGVTTFKNAAKIKEIAAKVPQNSIVLETDAPYLTPVPFRGQANHSKYLKYVRDEIAKLRNISPEEVEKFTTENFERVFKKWKK